MAYVLIIPVKCSAMSTACFAFTSSGAYWKKLTTSGVYIKTGGTSRLDPRRFLFLVSRNSSQATTAQKLTIISGSTAGNSDYQPGGYSTKNNLDITIDTASTAKTTLMGSRNIQAFFIPEVARFLDTDEFIKMKPNVQLTSAANVNHGAKIAALYLKMGGH